MKFLRGGDKVSQIAIGQMGVDWEERISFDKLRKERKEKAKNAIEDSDLSALFTFSMHDTRYITGFRGHLGPGTFRFGSWATTVLPKHGEPILYTKDLEHARKRMSWIDDENIQHTKNLLHPGRVPKWAEDVKERIGDDAKGKIGIDRAIPLSYLNALKESFPKAEFVDGTGVINNAKMIKTSEEIKCQKIATAITESGFSFAMDYMRPGVRECEVLAKAWERFTALGSEWSQCANIVTSGPNTAPYRRITSDRIIMSGDLVIIDIGACFNGYWGDWTRTYLCGKDGGITEEMKDLYQESYDALFNAISKATPGNTTLDIIKEIDTENSYGLSSAHGCGVNPWEPPLIARGVEETELKPDMLINIEPYAGKPGVGGVRLENQIRVTENEPEILSTYPFDERLLHQTHPLDETTPEP
ncbi:hypothetical protein AKJ66_02510 [candidate division MSBL1 archaeon SCGC-AAA259E22]|uniref:Peptidase M24 domain-containing protein n=1 Tax=candidate division MSBL1 archaeon SCGC-AAA259E22 TaxID=1698265 RepID=A0A133UGB8_9EURY|nr:hypothetical protein AKJ66_02510 [candidate division MSBL1 archaeon SCGC-AAA259E22]